MEITDIWEDIPIPNTHWKVAAFVNVCDIKRQTKNPNNTELGFKCMRVWMGTSDIHYLLKITSSDKAYIFPSW